MDKGLQLSLALNSCTQGPRWRQSSSGGIAGDGGLGYQRLAVATSGSSREGGCPPILITRLKEKDLPSTSHGVSAKPRGWRPLHCGLQAEL